MTKLSAFRTKVFNNKDQQTLMMFSGAINEEAKLPNLKDFKGSPLHIDLEGVTFINSLGIRQWIHWLDTADGVEVSLLRVPPLFIDQVNIVDGFLPKNMKVLSFYVPYVCEKCEAESLQLFSEGKEYSKGKLEHRSVFCGDCKCGMEVSPVAERYFNFLGIKRN